MDFDRMLDVWRAQNTAQQYEVNREALRAALNAEQAEVERMLRDRRWALRALLVIGGGMAIWAGFWIAITISNGWPAIYAITAGASFAMCVFGVGALWASRGPGIQAQRDFDTTLQAEVRRNLALADGQLALTRRWIVFNLGAGAIAIGATLFFWTLNHSQGISNSQGWLVILLMLVALMIWGARKEREAMRRDKPKLELRRQHLRELLETLQGDE